MHTYPRIYTGACNTTHANVKQEFPEHTISGTDQVAIEPINVMFADISKCLTYTKRTIHTESLHGKQIIVPYLIGKTPCTVTDTLKILKFPLS